MQRAVSIRRYRQGRVSDPPEMLRSKPDAKACEKFAAGLPQETEFASKEYLSKELLQYMLRLELLPEIEDLAGLK